MTGRYLCPKHGQLLDCDVSAAGERICPTCGAPVLTDRKHTDDELETVLDGMDANERAGLMVGMLPVRIDEELDEDLTNADVAELMRLNPEGHL